MRKSSVKSGHAGQGAGKAIRVRRLAVARPRGGLYTFAVTALAVFLVALVIRPPQPVGYEWESSIYHAASGNETSARQLVTADPRDELLALCRQAMTSAGAASDEATALHVQVQPDAVDPLARLIVIRQFHVQREVGQSCLTQLVSSFVAAHNRPDGEAQLAARLDEAASQQQFWKARVATIEQELNDYLDREVARQRADRSAAVDQTQTDGDPQAPGSAPNRVVNPRWEFLIAQFHEADFRLRELLEKFTEAHPQVIEARRMVAALDQALQATPRFLDSPAAAPEFANAATPELVGNGPSTPTGATFDEQQARQAARQTSTAVTLAQALAEAEAKWRSAERAFQEVPPKGSSVAESAVMERAPALAKVRRAAVDPVYLLSLAAPSLAVAAAVTLVRGKVQNSTTLSGADDVERSLALPVYGTLSTDDESAVAIATVKPMARVVQRIVSLCEFAIAATLILLLVCALVSPGFAQDAVQDPFGAIASALGRFGISH